MRGLEMKGTEESGCREGGKTRLLGYNPLEQGGLIPPQSLASPISQRPHTKWKEQLVTWHSRKKKNQFSMAFLF